MIRNGLETIRANWAERYRLETLSHQFATLRHGPETRTIRGRIAWNLPKRSPDHIARIALQNIALHATHEWTCRQARAVERRSTR